LFAQSRTEIGGSESEHVRRTLDDYIDKLIAWGELVDSGPVAVVFKSEEKG